MLWGYPSSPDALLGHAEPWAVVTPWGQLIGAVIMFFVLGFIPGYVLSWILKKVGLLRIPREVELAGLDYHAVDDDAARTKTRCSGRAGPRRRRAVAAE